VVPQVTPYPDTTDPVILTDRDPWYSDSATRRGWPPKPSSPSGYVALLSLQGYLKGPFLQQSEGGTLLILDFLEVFVHWYTTWR